MSEIPPFLLEALKAGGTVSIIIVALGWFAYREIKAQQQQILGIVEEHKQDFKNVLEQMIRAVNDLTNAVKERK